jgi:tetratricopeptide (TPR) repeat protein
MEGAAVRWRGLDAKSPSPYLVLAQHAAQQGDKKRALSELDNLAKANEGTSQMALLRAQVLNELGFNEVAERAFEQLPNEPNLVKAKADYYLKHGKEAKARQTIEELLAANPKDADAAIWLSRILVPKGELDEAIRRFDGVLKLDIEAADRERLMLAKASLLADQKKMDEAKKLTDEVLKQNQGNLDAHYLMGNMLLGTGKSEEAEIHLNQVAAGRADNPNAFQLLARSQFQNKKDAMALETLKNGLKANPGSLELRMDLVRVHLVSKETDQAVRVLSDGLALKADEPVLLKGRGEVFMATKEYAKAETDFRKLIEIQPNIPAGYLEMGQLMLTQSKTDQAIEWTKKAMDTENGWQQALPALLNLYLSKDDTKSAVAAAESEAARRSDAHAAQFLLGQVHLKTGNYAKAEGAFLKTIQLAPEWIDPYRGLVETYRKGGKGDKLAAKVEELPQGETHQRFHADPGHPHGGQGQAGGGNETLSGPLLSPTHRFHVEGVDRAGQFLNPRCHRIVTLPAYTCNPMQRASMPRQAEKWSRNRAQGAHSMGYSCASRHGGGDSYRRLQIFN